MAKRKACPKKLQASDTVADQRFYCESGDCKGIDLDPRTNSAVAAVRLRGTSQRKKRKEGD